MFELQCGVVVYNINLNSLKNIFSLNNKPMTYINIFKRVTTLATSFSSCSTNSSQFGTRSKGQARI
jgi:hypothetical protein